jgi:hypothetical protein
MRHKIRSRRLYCIADREACMNGFGKWKFSVKRPWAIRSFRWAWTVAEALPGPGRFRRHRHAESSRRRTATTERSRGSWDAMKGTHVPSCPSSRRYTYSPSATNHVSSCSQKSPALISSANTCCTSSTNRPSFFLSFFVLLCFQRSRNR